jgi:hypothetical protein
MPQGRPGVRDESLTYLKAPIDQVAGSFGIGNWSPALVMVGFIWLGTWPPAQAELGRGTPAFVMVGFIRDTPSSTGSGAELAEVVVEVLVHEDGPLLGCHLAEEGVGMGGADGWATGGKAVDEGGETVLLFGEIAVVGNHQTFGGGGVAAHGDLVLERHGLDDAADEAANQHAWRRSVAEGHLQAAGAVGHCLRGVH